MEEEANPAQHPIPQPQLREAGEEEVAVHRVESLGDVQQEEGARGAGGSQRGRDELSQEDVVSDAPVGEEGALLPPNDRVQGTLKAQGEDLGEQLVVGVEEGDGAVGGRAGGIRGPRLGDGGDGTTVEEAGEAVELDGSAEEASEKGEEAALPQAPGPGGEAIRARG
jgi:hypothetical protein